MGRVLFVLWLLLIASVPSYAVESQEHVALSLKQALAKAYSVNPQVLMASARLEGALARIEEARSNLLPQVSAVVDGGRQTRDLRSSGMKLPGTGPQVGPFNSFDGRGQISLNLLDLESIARLKAAAKGSEQSKAQLAKVRSDILSFVATLYVQANRSSQASVLMASVVASDFHAHEVARIRLTQGSGSQLELEKAHSALAHSQYLLVKAQSQAREDQLNLSDALALPPGQVIDFTDDDEFEQRLKSLHDEAGKDNADIVFARSQISAQHAAVRAARAGFFPTITALGSMGRSGLSPTASSTTYSIGVQAKIPIWEGGRTQARLKESKALLKEALINFEDTKRQQESKRIYAEDALIYAQAMVDAAKAQVDVTDKLVNLAIERQRLGNGSLLELREAESSKASVADEYNAAKAFLISAQIQLAQALGKFEDLIKS